MSDYKELIERARDPESWKHGHIWALCEELIDALESAQDARDHQAKLIAEAVAQERERCAEIAEGATNYAARHICDDIAAAIRASKGGHNDPS